MGGLSTPADAALIANSFTVGYYFPNTASAYSFASFNPGESNPSSVFIAIDPGQDATGDVEGVTTLGIDMSAQSIMIGFSTVLSMPTWNSVAFSGLIFESQEPLHISAASVGAATTMAGFDLSRVGIEPTRILLNWQGLSYQDGTKVVVDLSFGPQPVPLPAALGPMVAVLALTFALRRRGARLSGSQSA